RHRGGANRGSRGRARLAGRHAAGGQPGCSGRGTDRAAGCAHTRREDSGMGMIDMAARLAAVRAGPGATVAEALRQLEVAGTGVLLLTDDADRLLGVLTNGDIRRAILAGRAFDSPAKDVA